MLNSTVSETVRETRKAKAMSLQDFGNAIGISGMAVSYWETGKRDPSLEQVAWMLASRCDWVRQLALDIYAVQQRTLLSLALQKRDGKQTDCEKAVHPAKPSAGAGVLAGGGE